MQESLPRWPTIIALIALIVVAVVTLWIPRSDGGLAKEAARGGSASAAPEGSSSLAGGPNQITEGPAKSHSAPSAETRSPEADYRAVAQTTASDNPVVRSSQPRGIAHLMAAARSFDRGETRGWEFPLFDGNRVVLRTLAHQHLRDNVGTLTARAEGDPLSHVALSYVDGVAAGVVHLPTEQKAYQLRPLASGGYVLREVDESMLPACQHGPLP